ncbi:MAG: CHAT domain-containing protein [Pseudomonadota bacterium]
MMRAKGSALLVFFARYLSGYGACRILLLIVGVQVIGFGLATAQGSYEDSPRRSWDYMNDRCIYYYELGHYARAREFAERSFDRALQERQNLDIDYRVIASLECLAVSYEADELQAEAVGAYKTLLDEADARFGEDSDDSITTAIALAKLKLEMGKQAEALELIKGKIQVSRSQHARDSWRMVQLQELRGEIHLEMGNFSEALEDIQYSSKQTARIAGVVSHEYVNSLRIYGGLLWELGDERGATEKYGQAIRISMRLGDFASISSAHHQYAVFLWRLGYIDQARDQIEQALRVAESGLVPTNPVRVRIYRDAEIFNAGFEIGYMRNGYIEELAQMQADGLEGSLNEARVALNYALFLSRAASSPAPETQSSRLTQSSGATRSELADFIRFKVFQRWDDAVYSSHTYASLCAIAAGSFADNSSQSLQTIAIYLQKTAVNIIQDKRESLGPLQNYSLSFVDRYEPVYLDLIEMLVRAGRFAEADQVGRLLKQHEYRQFIKQRAGVVDGIASSRSELTKTEADWDRQFASWRERPNRIALELAVLSEKQKSGVVLTTLEVEQLSQLKEQHEVAFARYANDVNVWISNVRNISNETIQTEAERLNVENHVQLRGEISEIGDDVAILQIVALDDSLHFFLITPLALKHFETPVSRADLNAAIFEARKAIKPGPTGYPAPEDDVKRLFGTLYDYLIRPVEEELDVLEPETLMLNLQGSIRYVPFAALYDGEKYLTQRYQLALFSPLVGTRFDEAGSLTEAVGFGVTQAHVVDGIGRFPELTGTKSELETLLGSTATSGILSGQVHLDDGFTKAKLEAALSERPQIVHIASHFLMRPSNDAESFLLLGNGDTLSLAEIYTSVGLVFYGVELLTLSACSTGLNSQGDADVDLGSGVEFEGFGVLAQRRGAEAVVATLWDVADQPTSDLMKVFYSELVKGDPSKAAALQTAQLELIDNPATRHPYNWAPFVLMGNWR